GVVVERDVGLAVVLDVVVVGAEESAVLERRRARDAVHAARHARGTDRPAVARAALDLLQVETGGEGMTALADERSAARVAPDPVQRRVRAAVGLAAHHPEDLR